MILVVLLFALCVPAFAEFEMPDITRADCSITLSFRNRQGTPIQGGGFTIYYVATTKIDEDVLRYDISDTEFAESGASLGDLDDTHLAQQLAVYAEKNKLTGTKRFIDNNGELSFEALPVGLYLIVQTEHILGYYTINPFFIAVPELEEGSDEWNYHVTGNPKGEPTPYSPPDTPPPPTEPPTADTVSLTVKKTWTDDGKSRPLFVSVQLLRGEAIYEEITLSNENNWTYTWSELDGSYVWSVQEVDIPKGYSASYSVSGMETIITNTASLIQTGQLNWPIPLMSELGVLLFAAGWLLTFAGKEKKQK